MAAKMTSDDEGDEGVLHSCEICGQSNLAVGALRHHVESAHIRYVVLNKSSTYLGFASFELIHFCKKLFPQRMHGEANKLSIIIGDGLLYRL